MKQRYETNPTGEPDYSLDPNTVFKLAYFNCASANKLKFKASKQIKKLLAGMDENNNSRMVGPSYSNKLNKSTDEDVEERSSEKPMKKCTECGKWGYHTAEKCKAKDNYDKFSR